MRAARAARGGLGSCWPSLRRRLPTSSLRPRTPPTRRWPGGDPEGKAGLGGTPPREEVPLGGGRKGRRLHPVLSCNESPASLFYAHSLKQLDVDVEDSRHKSIST